MAEKLLYILGAGASANILPLAKSVWNSNDYVSPNIPKIPGLAYNLKNIDLNKVFDSLNEPVYQEKKIIFKREFNQLSLKADQFGDVDTFAKYIYLKKPTELNSIKKTLSRYFSIEQFCFGKTDTRYLPWLVGIMSNNRFPENVKILNWNYDFQVELAGANFGNIEAIEYSGSGYSFSPSFINHFPTLDPYSDQIEYLSLIHLNGIAGFSRDQQHQTSSIYNESVRKNNVSIINHIINDNLNPQIFFAWEESDYHNKLMNHVFKMIEETTIIIVIGYSFPYYNRDIDKKIFEKILSGKKLKIIYYQDPVLTGEQLKSQFSLSRDLKIINIKNVSNFHIPFEY